MFRKLILSALLSVGALSGMGRPARGRGMLTRQPRRRGSLLRFESECGTAATGSAAHLRDRCDAEHAAHTFGPTASRADRARALLVS